ncbi:hypothetical protein IHE45_12G058300 [Dioscorea alata]|uniref:Uncharacterized protein n=1 Tax=Dioscorea alata TaxID=55571 RepID=A0ACB7V2Q0_DIOAL|nr:hypothetical protein IHE45_12G058300 [Dioscorea alata]
MMQIQKTVLGFQLVIYLRILIIFEKFINLNNNLQELEGHNQSFLQTWCFVGL